MSLYGMMRTSASGMSAQANMLSTVADNVANSATTGFKRSTEEFSTLVLESGVSGYESGAVESKTRSFISQQGAFNYTSSETDLAIRGDGFFIVSGSDGSVKLTRAGAFTKDGDGFLVNAAGYKLMGYPGSNGTSPVLNGLAGLEEVNISGLGMADSPSTTGRFYVNLPPDSAVVPAVQLPSANTASSAYSRTSSLVAYDNVGAEIILDVYETKTAANTWEIAVFDRSTASSGGGFPYSSGPLATANLSFDPASGALASSSPISLSVPIPNGATLAIDLSQCTELAGDYAVRAASVNGSAPSEVDRIDVGPDGALVAVFKNGERALAYQLPLGNVASPDNLKSISGNVFEQSAESGSLLVGVPGTTGLGELVAGALEKSTVDIATELTNMIEAQNSYVANSKVFQTAADLMDVLMNLKR